MSPKCTSWLGHRFEARYDSGAAETVSLSDIGVVKMTETAYLELMRLRRGETYIHDICVHCGHVIEPTIQNHAASADEVVS
jgi:hypothetical protein